MNKNYITLVAMSGVGKTTLANKLSHDKWFHYSVDYRIGTRYLGEAILDNVKSHMMQDAFLASLLRSDSIYVANNITVDNLKPLSTFVGKVGDLDYDTFLQRQHLHMDAECHALIDIPLFIKKAQEIYGYEYFIADTGGSCCEVIDFSNVNDPVLNALKQTLVVFIDTKDDEKIIERGLEKPKPMYYHPDFLTKMVGEYGQNPNDFNGDDFIRYVFPKLMVHRKERYQKMADITIMASDAEKVGDEQDFFALIKAGMENAN